MRDRRAIAVVLFCVAATFDACPLGASPALLLSLVVSVALLFVLIFTPSLRLLDTPGSAAALVLVSGSAFSITLHRLFVSDAPIARALLDAHPPAVGLTVGLSMTLLLAATGHLIQESQRKRRALQVALAELRSSEAKFRRFAEHIRDVFWIVDWPSGRVTYVSPAYEEIWGRPRGDLDAVSRELRGAVHPDDRDRVERAFRAAAETEYDETFRVVRPDGEVRWVHDHAAAIRDETGTPRQILGVAKDVTARERQQGRLTQLAQRIEAVREEERTELAREIHDVLGQALTAIQLDLNWVRERARGGEELEDERLAAMIRIVDETMDSVRRLSTRLRPTVLDDLGLKAALDWQVREFSQRTGCTCRLSVLDEELSPDDARDTALFRILQESLTNVTRHAGAKHVTVRLDRTGDSLRLTVTDDGRGIRPVEADGDGSLGLIGMRERADALGGRFTVTPAERGGTMVRVTIPMTRQESQGREGS